MHTQVFCGGDLIIFRPTVPMEPKFAGYALDCAAAQTQKSLMGRGVTIMHIYSGQLKYLWLPLPTLAEQTAIARFLDHADEQIQRYIASKEQLIALLEEERQALIHQAVTRGLDPNVPAQALRSGVVGGRAGALGIKKNQKSRTSNYWTNLLPPRHSEQRRRQTRSKSLEHFWRGDSRRRQCVRSISST